MNPELSGEADGRAGNRGDDAYAETPHGNERHRREHDHQPVGGIAITEGGVAGNEHGKTGDHADDSDGDAV